MGGGAEKKESGVAAQKNNRKSVTLEELSKHRTPSDAWLTMKGKHLMHAHCTEEHSMPLGRCIQSRHM